MEANDSLPRDGSSSGENDPRESTYAARVLEEEPGREYETLMMIAASNSLSLAEQARICRLLATLAEHAGELRMVVDLEREAFALECALHVQTLELALHAMELAARHALRTLDADIERERTWLASHELTAANGEMDDRRRAAAEIEQRLHGRLTTVPPGEEQSVREALLKALAVISNESAGR